MLNVIENCLILERTYPNNKKPLEDEDDIETYIQRCKIEDAVYLSDDIIFKMMSICIMSFSKLQNKESHAVKQLIAFTFSMLSHLVHSTILRIQESLIDFSIANGEPVDLNLHFADFEGELIKEENDSNRKNESSNPHESLDLNEKKENREYLQIDSNHSNGVKRTKDKSKSLLTKLRRRKRRNSSDSDNSDADGTAVLSSSDEMNSDISETEEDALSEENPISDEALSDDDLSDEEETKNATKFDNVIDNQINGHSLPAEKTANNANILENGKKITGDDTMDSKFNDKGSTTNSSSAITLTPNADSNSACEESSGSINTIAYVDQLKKQNIDQSVVLDVLVSEGILSSIKLWCDWIKCNPEIIKTFAKSLNILMKRITILLNLINMDVNLFSKTRMICPDFLPRIDNFEEGIMKVPLPEDVNLRGMKALEEVHKDLDWKLLRKFKIDKKEQALLRSLKVVQFGKYLTSIQDLGMSYDEQKNIFIMKNFENVSKGVTKDGNNLEMDHPRGKLMRHMGRLWLKAEVRALETRLRSRLMSPYLVPDHEALAKHTPALKRLVYAKKFIIVIPAIGK